MLRNTSVRARLIVGAVIPTLLLLAAAGWQAFGAFDDYRDTANVEVVAELALEGREYLHTIQVERTAALRYLLSSRDSDQARVNDALREMAAAQTATDAAAASLISARDELDVDSLSDGTRETLQSVESSIDDVADIRALIVDDEGPTLVVYNAYDDALNALLDSDRLLINEVQSPEIEETLRALQIVSNVKNSTLALSAVRLLDVESDVDPGQREQIESILISQRATWLEIGDGVLSPSELDVLEETATPQIACVESSGSAGCDDGGNVVDAMVEGSGSVGAAVQLLEQQYAANVVNTAETTRVRSVTTLIVTAVLGVSLLALLLLLNLLVSSVMQPLRRLTSLAERVRTSLKDDVDRIAAGEAVTESAFDSAVGEELTSRKDELGDLARAMRSSTGEAVAIASRQAAMRGGVARTIEDVARREQTLVERQLSLLDALEDAERDPDQLAQLFKLDHLATRMRRNAENLLLLSSGQLPGLENSSPVSLVDVVRTAASEIEQYGRVDVRIGVAATVAGAVATPISHLLAELIENAAQFSPPDCRVLVTGYTDTHGITVAISDEGLGMTQGDLADARRRLASPPLLEVAESRRLGLYVVGLIANRLGLDVDLDLSDSGKGLTATVAIPEAAFVGGVDRSSSQRTIEPVRSEPKLASNLDSSGDALAALSQLLDASPSSPPDLPAEVVPVQEQTLPTRSTDMPAVQTAQTGGISLSAASKGRKVEFDPSSIRDLLSGLNGIGDDSADFNERPAPPGAVQPAPQAQPAPRPQPTPQHQATPQPQTAPQAQPAPPAAQQAPALPVSSHPIPPLPVSEGGPEQGSTHPPIPTGAEPGPSLPTRARPAAAGFASQATGFSAQMYDAAAPAPQDSEPEPDVEAPAQQRRRRSTTTPSWSTPYAPQEQKL